MLAIPMIARKSCRVAAGRANAGRPIICAYPPKNKSGAVLRRPRPYKALSPRTYLFGET